MNFLRLLNPWACTAPEDVGWQQRNAAEVFPEEVAKSRLHYFRPGDPIHGKGTRFLIAVAASFSLPDLRFLDVINKALRDNSPPVWVDVFGIHEVRDSQSWQEYFPGTAIVARTPVVGKWQDGRLLHVRFGAEGMNDVLNAAGSRMRAHHLTQGLSPPAPELMEDYDV
jgi:hypothetical protein